MPKSDPSRHRGARTGSPFRKLDSSGRKSRLDPTRHGLFAQLSALVAKRYKRLTGLGIVLGKVDWPGPPPEDRRPPAHPRCADCAGSEVCQTSWLDHLALLQAYPEVHWHRCEHGQMCAIVPLVVHGRCVAACKLVCPGTMQEAKFERNVEVLDLLVEHLLATEGERLQAMLRERGLAPPLKPVPAPDLPTEKVRRPSRLQVARAMEYIERHYADPGLTVADVARTLGMNVTYLAHLFSLKVGVRMSRYIANQRIEHAKKLLVATNWQVRRVAFESGHGNSDWFSQAFHSSTGMTPREYRRRNRVR